MDDDAAGQGSDLDALDPVNFQQGCNLSTLSGLLPQGRKPDPKSSRDVMNIVFHQASSFSLQ
jgi:hypothetical protein